VGKAVLWTDTTTFLPYRVDEDGKTGLLSLSKNSNNKLQYQILRSTGSNLLTPSSSVTTSFTYTGDIALTRTTSHGTADLLNITSTSKGAVVTVLRFYNDALVEVNNVQQPGTDKVKGCTFHTADLRGTGRAGCLFTQYDSSNKMKLFFLPSAAAQPNDCIGGYANGLGATVSVIYAPLSDSDVYSASEDDVGSTTAALNALAQNTASSYNPGSSTTPSTRVHSRGHLVHSPKYVVRELKACAHPSLHPDLVAQTTFKYQNARIDFDGRGWLGFKSISKIHQHRNTTSTTTYLQAFPFIGRISQILTSETSTGKALRGKTYKWAPLKTEALSHYVTMPDLTESHFEGGSFAHSAQALHTYDAFGNIVKTVISAPSSGRTMTITTTYLNDEKDWIIGAKLQETIDPGDCDSRCVKFKYLAGMAVVYEKSMQLDASNWSTETMQFDAAGNVTCALGPGPAKQVMTYTSNYSFLSSKTSYVSSTATLVQKWTYNEGHGHPSSTTDPNMHITAYEYDIMGHISSVSEGDSAAAMIVVEKHSSRLVGGDRLFVKTELNDLATNSWTTEVSHVDGANRVWRVEKTIPGSNGLVVYQDHVYDGAGRLIREAGPYNSSTPPRWKMYTYDTLSRPLVTTAPSAIDGQDPVTVKSEYTFASGKTTVTETRSGGGESTTMRSHILQYSPAMEGSSSHSLLKPMTVTTVDELGHRVDRSFNGFGNATSVKDGAGVEITVRWDRLEREVEQRITQLNGSTRTAISHYTIEYDDTSYLTTMHNKQSGSTIVLARDYLHRIISKTIPEETVTLTYDVGGSNAKHRLATVKSSAGDFQCFLLALPSLLTIFARH
jgi:hypothetical protein